MKKEDIRPMLIQKTNELVRMDNLPRNIALNVATVMLIHRITKFNNNREEQ